MRRFFYGTLILTFAGISPWVQADTRPGKASSSQLKARPTLFQALFKDSQRSGPKPSAQKSLTDQELVTAVENALRKLKSDGKLKKFDLNLYVESGVVWLKGEVASQQQKSLVDTAARSTSGVRQVVNDLQIKGSEVAATRTDTNVRQVAHNAPASSPRDAQIVSSIKSKIGELKNQGALKNFRLRVHSNEGVVWMNGEVANAQQRDLALRVAQMTPGVVQVVKDITLRTAAPAATAAPLATTHAARPVSHISRSDQDIVDDIAASLRSARDAGHLQGFGIDVNCEDGIVWMMGKVTTPRQRAIALAAAKRIPGVKEVNNELEVENAAVASKPAEQMKLASTHSLRNPVAAAMPTHGTPRPHNGLPVPIQRVGQAGMALAGAPVALAQGIAGGGMPRPMPYQAAGGTGVAPARYDHPQVPGYAWPSYSAHPNYAALTYPKQYSPTAWPYIGPFYPYPQVPLGWRKVTLEWDDGWWMLDFHSK